ncbi:DUF7210 family protein [Ottowia testudinis]|uniref:DUF7210 domain-containing protein n=1 Tax=Ottowia testudinis TaxID=2816950 RepID=A0A975CDR4_9BURK|nr:hypothetical protein [Ottowia testudinis]QTD44380.1 hypothetical protein J1M35_14910 [Ottowia testudinis]
MNTASAIAAGGLAVPVGDTAPASPLTRKVRLIKTHIHAGLPCKPGDDIELLHDLADWLVAEGAAEHLSTDAKPHKPSNKKETP